MKKRVAFCTLGCKVNQYETNAMIEQFINKGYEIVEFEERVDIYIINTCTVTNMADRKSRQMLRRVKEINKEAILGGQYASNTGASETESTINDETSNKTDETYTKKVKGNSGVSATAQRMIAQYRENIIAIDEQIIKELDKLFMGLY